MASKKAPKKVRKSAPSAGRRKAAPPPPKLSLEAQRQIAAVVLGSLAVLLTFACFNFGGSLVTSMFHVLRVLVGYTAYLLPVLLGAMAYRLFRADEDHPIGGLTYFGITGVLVSLAGLFHLGFAGGDPSAAAQAGSGGGLVGYGITSAMLGVLNVAASSVILLALFVVCLIAASNADLKALGKALGALMTVKKRDGEAVGSDMELKVNDNSGAPAMAVTSLPLRGELNVGAARRPLSAPAVGAPGEHSTEALTANSEQAWTPPSIDLLEATSTKADAGM